MLHLSAPGDALYAYYALYHDDERTELRIHQDAEGYADGFVAVCQTGQRLFEPTVVLRTPKPNVAVELLADALVPGRPYYLITTTDLRDAVTQVMDVERVAVNHVYQIDLSRFERTINVLVVPEEGVEERPRFVIRSQEEVVAEAGVTWMSPHFAAIYVRATTPARERGWGRSVMIACTNWVVHSGRQALFIVGGKDEANITLSEAVGYRDTGAREFVVEGVRR
jgi:hypothetical protein